MKRDAKVYLADILEAIEKIEEYTHDLTEAEFNKNIQVQDAVLRRLEIMGEAVKGIPDDIKKRYPKIPWKKIAGMRDVVSHEYFGVRLDRVWNVIKNELKDLKAKIELIQSWLIHQDLAGSLTSKDIE